MAQENLYTFGTLSRLAEVRSFPSGRLTGHTATPRIIQENPISIVIVTDDHIGMNVFNTIMAYYVSRFYHLPNHHDIDKMSLAASLCGIVANCSDWGSLRPWTSMRTACKAAGIDLNFREMTSAHFMTFANGDARLQKFLSNWSYDVAKMLRSTKLPFIFACILVFSFTKNLTDANHEAWFKRQILTFSERVQDPWTPNNTTVATYPLLAQMKSLFCFISAFHSLRKALFQEIMAIGAQKDNFVSNVFCEILHSLRFYGMQHLTLIEKYIFKEHPEFLDTIFLRGLKPRFDAAMAALLKFPEDTRMYAMLLYDKYECALLDRRIFDEAATVAATIARIKNPAVEINFPISKGKYHERIQKMVEETFELRTTVFQLGIPKTGRPGASMIDVDK